MSHSSIYSSKSQILAILFNIPLSLPCRICAMTTDLFRTFYQVNTLELILAISFVDEMVSFYLSWMLGARLVWDSCSPQSQHVLQHRERINHNSILMIDNNLTNKTIHMWKALNIWKKNYVSPYINQKHSLYKVV